MTRIILVSVVLGIATTLAIAWISAAAFDPLFLPAVNQPADDAGLPGLNNSRLAGAWLSSSDDDSVKTTHRFGWPFFAVGYTRTLGTDENGGIVDVRSGALDIGLKRTTRYGMTDDLLLPVAPMVTGLVADFLIFSTAWFAPLYGPGAARRGLRKKRGRCPICAYDLRGGTPQAGRPCHRIQGCPECGWNRAEAEE